MLLFLDHFLDRRAHFIRDTRVASCARYKLHDVHSTIDKLLFGVLTQLKLKKKKIYIYI